MIRRLCAGAAVGLLWLVAMVALAPAASAHSVSGVGATNWKTTLSQVTPELPGLTIKIVENGSRVEVINHGPEVLVYGYDGEPYLRIGPQGVFINTRSPAAYLNCSRNGCPVPATANAKAPPNWEQISTGQTILWHDHRTHWMGKQLPPEVAKAPGQRHVQAHWTVTMVRGTQVVTASGDYVWVPGSRAFPWLILAVLLAGVGVAVAVRARPAPEATSTARPAPEATSTARPAPEATSSAQPASEAISSARPAPEAISSARPASEATSSARPAPETTSSARPAPEATNRAGSWRLLAVATAVLVAVDFGHAVGVGWFWAGNTAFRISELLEGSSYQIPGWILGVIAVKLLWQGYPRGRVAAACAGASALLFTGVLDFDVLSRPYGPFSGPLTVDRICVTVCLGLGLGVLVGALALIRAGRVTVEYEGDDTDDTDDAEDADDTEDADDDGHGPVGNGAVVDPLAATDAALTTT